MTGSANTDELRAALASIRVPYDTARAEEMIRTAINAAAPPRNARWTTPLLASAAVAAVAGGVAGAGALVSDRGGGGHPGPPSVTPATSRAPQPGPLPPVEKLTPGTTIRACATPPAGLPESACWWVVIPSR
jgi:hypothetical protein